jgi:hypothetical protein
LYYYLKQHRRVYLPWNKEPWFFAYARNPDAEQEVGERVRVVTSAREYAQLFSPAPSAACRGEASTVYLYRHGVTIENIRRFHPRWGEVRIVIILRDPVARAWSHYLYNIREGYSTESREEAFDPATRAGRTVFNDYLGYGLYHDQVSAYVDAFRNVRVYLFDDLVTQPADLVADLCEFLEIELDPSVDTSLRANISGAPRHPRLTRAVLRPHCLKQLVKPFMPELVRLRVKNALLEKMLRREPIDANTAAALRAFYRDDVARVAGLLGRDLSTWLS